MTGLGLWASLCVGRACGASLARPAFLLQEVLEGARSQDLHKAGLQISQRGLLPAVSPL